MSSRWAEHRGTGDHARHAGLGPFYPREIMGASSGYSLSVDLLLGAQGCRKEEENV